MHYLFVLFLAALAFDLFAYVRVCTDDIMHYLFVLFLAALAFDLFAYVRVCTDDIMHYLFVLFLAALAFDLFAYVRVCTDDIMHYFRSRVSLRACSCACHSKCWKLKLRSHSSDFFACCFL
eukprot:scpid112697/ scgid19577/ 